MLIASASSNPISLNSRLREKRIPVGCGDRQSVMRLTALPNGATEITVEQRRFLLPAVSRVTVSDSNGHPRTSFAHVPRAGFEARPHVYLLREVVIDCGAAPPELKLIASREDSVNLVIDHSTQDELLDWLRALIPVEHAAVRLDD